MQTQVGIVGGGPAGLLLSHLLNRRGIESVVLEDRDREHVEQRVRAGVLEQGTVELLAELGLDERLRREGLVQHGIELRFGGRAHRIPLSELTGGGTTTIYAQREVVRDLIGARLDAGLPLLFEVDGVSLHGFDSEQPSIRFRHEGAGHELQLRLGVEGWTLKRGPILERGITSLRSFVVEPMQHGRLFLAGDAAHIVPPVGAKGLNLAAADAHVLAEALARWYRSGDASRLDGYSAACLPRVWRAEQFTFWMTTMLHRFGLGRA
jgi:2-polyprenyl-6-methoxyphenol hydroxylase-like FAD-dependent oxidoreductase